MKAYREKNPRLPYKTGRKPGRRSTYPEFLELIRDRPHMSAKAIADFLQVSISTVSKHRKRYSQETGKLFLRKGDGFERYLELLEVEPSITGVQAAKRLGVGRRTVYEYKRKIRDGRAGNEESTASDR